MSELGHPFLSPDLRRLIEAERQVDDPPARMKRAVAERVDRSLGLGGAMMAAAPSLSLEAPVLRDSSPPPISPPPAAFFGWKAAGASIALVMAGAAALALALRSPSPPARVGGGDRMALAQESTVVTEAPEANRRVATEPAPIASAAAVGRASSRHHRNAPRAARSVDTLAAERTILDDARAALVKRDASGALAALRSHARAFPRGQLREERDSMRVQALALAHDTVAMRVARDKFVRHFPRSMFMPAVEQAVEEAP
jgi:hypothetical protein